MVIRLGRGAGHGLVARHGRKRGLVAMRGLGLTLTVAWARGVNMDMDVDVDLAVAVAWARGVDIFYFLLFHHN